MHSAKSSNGRIEWTVDDKGQLTEVGPSSPKFTMSAVDTLILAGLLLNEMDAISRGTAFEKTGIRVSKPRKIPEVPYEGDLDYAEGIEIDD